MNICAKCGRPEFNEHPHGSVGCPPARCVECGWGPQYVTHNYERCVIGGYEYHPFIQAGPAAMAALSPITVSHEDAK